jgi:peptidyl-prolyl cis-trans isomerase A (cyclophilin A)
MLPIPPILPEIPKESTLRPNALLGMMGTIGKPTNCWFLLYGDLTVSHRWKPIVACLSLMLFATVVGCGGSGDAGKSPSAAIDGKGKDAPTGEGGQSPAAAKPTIDLQHPVVVIDTSLGKITVELNREKALLTVDNFLSYVNSSFYDQTIIHQVCKGQVKGFIGGGYGTNLVARRVHPPIRNGADNQLKNTRGTIAMFRLPNDIDSATSQFFINAADNPVLDYKGRTAEDYGYCVFGKVIEGLDVVDAINAVATHDVKGFQETPTDQVVVKSIRLIR